MLNCGDLVKLWPNKTMSLSRFRTDAVVFVVYVVSTIILTYPVAFSAHTIPGVGTDGYWFLWVFGEFKNAVFTHTNPLYTSSIYYPVGVNLAFSTTSFFNAAISLPLQLIWDLPHAYTFIWLMSFFLSGYGAFVLMRYLGGSTKVAFVSGLIFMLCPYRFAHGLGHLNLIATEWIPFFVLFYIKTLRENKRLNPVITALFLSLTALCDLTYVVFLTAFSGLFLAFFFWTEKNPASRARILARAVATFLIFAGIISPLVLPMVQQMLSGSYMYSTYTDFVLYSADLVAFFIPSSLHPLFGGATAPLYDHLLGGAYAAESRVFIGFAGLALSALAILQVKTKEVRLWTVASAGFLVLSLGPVLQANGVVFVSVPSAVPLVSSVAVPVPLPYLALMFVPVFSILRVPSRWDIMVMLCVSVLSGYALQYITTRTRSSGHLFTKQNLVCIAFASLIVFEFLSVPYPTESTSVPSFYYQMASDPDNYAVIEVPANTPTQWDSLWMFYQTISHKQLVNGHVSRTPPSALDFIDSEPVANLLFHIQDFNTSNVPANVTELNPSTLSRYSIKYVIVHSEYLTALQTKLIDELFRNSTDTYPVVYEDGPMIVYGTKPSA